MLSDRIVEWMQKEVEKRGANGAILGLSGGVDSSVVAGLIKEAFGDNTLGVLLPTDGSIDKDTEYAKLVADEFNLETVTVNLGEVYDVFEGKLSEADVEEADVSHWPQTKLDASGTGNRAGDNMKPRLRMVSLHYLAEKMNYVVMGTSNKSEVITGYYTNNGDNATDLRPLGDLLKTEVWELAREVGVPEEIIERPPSAGLREGEADEDEIGISYKKLDAIYKALKDDKDLSKFETEKVKRVQELVNAAKDKEEVPVFEK
ncbi:NAD(+) synthase [Acetohalobium arabaticum]|uniref:NH(3)-dependent NAD(+) synthetase n=1 Tax=Acetohalobium arabaticum (strain ATCC 49924 / DSM 5501 / Z-7288) TaxID=574087 RepID=D9QU28_ACEAZ|nr:NAD(+) synthase [Acetohalobium arabaticum]ADL13749.1 NAD+ synthetase [Acetohalobium arabaticum DSM 5501]